MNAARSDRSSRASGADPARKTTARRRRALLTVRRAALAAGLVIAGAGATLAQPQPRQPTRSDLPCYERADDQTTLSREQALFLCRGARSLGPVTCYQRADDDTTLDTQQRIRLCRCSDDAAPVDCYERADQETLLSDDRIIDMCRPITTGRLTPLCVPIQTTAR